MKKMKKIDVFYLKDLDVKSMKECNDILETAGSHSTISVLNWEDEYPYCPKTEFYVARSKDSLFIKYKVNGKSLKAEYADDQSDVYRDSCVEFFCMPVDSDRYTNFEFNCIGTCLASNRKGREEDVKMLDVNLMSNIKRYSSVGTTTFVEKQGVFEWELCVKIPFDLMGIDKDNLPCKMKANFYKCADDTSSVHFVSWSPIDVKEPDFHRPDFFGDLYFK